MAGDPLALLDTAYVTVAPTIGASTMPLSALPSGVFADRLADVLARFSLAIGGAAGEAIVLGPTVAPVAGTAPQPVSLAMPPANTNNVPVATSNLPVARATPGAGDGAVAEVPTAPFWAATASPILPVLAEAQAGQPAIPSKASAATSAMPAFAALPVAPRDMTEGVTLAAFRPIMTETPGIALAGSPVAARAPTLAGPAITGVQLALKEQASAAAARAAVSDAAAPAASQRAAIPHASAAEASDPVTVIAAHPPPVGTDATIAPPPPPTHPPTARPAVRATEIAPTIATPAVTLPPPPVAAATQASLGAEVAVATQASVCAEPAMTMQGVDSAATVPASHLEHGAAPLVVAGPPDQPAVSASAPPASPRPRPIETVPHGSAGGKPPPSHPGGNVAAATQPDPLPSDTLPAPVSAPATLPGPAAAVASESGGDSGALEPRVANQGAVRAVAAPAAEATDPRSDSTMAVPPASPPVQDVATPPAEGPTPQPATPTVPVDTQAAPSVAGTASLPTLPTANPMQTIAQGQHQTPATQVAPALLTLASTSTGSQHMTLRLQPADLGTVQVRIDRPAEAPVRVAVSVSRPETLTLMLRDQSQLQRALDQAGVPQEGRSLTFQLAGQDGGSLPRQPEGFTRPDTGNPSASGGAAPDETPDGEATMTAELAILPSWRRAGLDITA